jgi:spermidine synthase
MDWAILWEAWVKTSVSRLTSEISFRSSEGDGAQLKRRVLNLKVGQVETRFFNTDAMISMVHFGKGVLDHEEMSKIKVNTQMNPILHSYYLSGSWAMY